MTNFWAEFAQRVRSKANSNVNSQIFIFLPDVQKIESSIHVSISVLKAYPKSHKNKKGGWGLLQTVKFIFHLTNWKRIHLLQDDQNNSPYPESILH